MGLEDDFIDFPFGAQIFRGDVKNLHEVPINDGFSSRNLLFQGCHFQVNHGKNHERGWIFFSSSLSINDSLLCVSPPN